MPDLINTTVVPLKAAMTDRPLVVSPQTPLREAIAHLNHPQPAATAVTEREDPSQALHQTLRSRYLVIAEAKQPLAIVTARELLEYTVSEPEQKNLQTVSNLSLSRPTTVMETTLTDAQQLRDLLQANQMRPLIVLDSLNNIIGLLTYEGLYPYLLQQPDSSAAVAKGIPAEDAPLVQQLQRVLEVTANKMGSEFFETSVLQLAEALNVAHVILTELKGPILRTLAFAMDHVLQPTLEYPIKDTPCEQVMATGEFFCECFVQKQFPNDPDLILLGAESYLGFAMYGAQGETVGHLCVLDREPILRSDWAVRLMRTFAARASAELERQQAIAALQTLNQELEAKVAERTADLQQSYQQLQDTQVQLVQSEKMSSLGQLVAGVAHEINNPVNFISGNLAPCLDYANDLSHLIGLYQAQYPQPTPEIETFIQKADIPYILEDFPHLIQSMTLGATRIQAIVQSLRTFAYAQQEGSKAIDLQENLDNTLVILQSRLKGRGGDLAIQVVKHYAALPLVNGLSGLLNQVFMNLLINAIDAIEQRQAHEDANYQGCLTITTQVLQPSKVAIAIQDNGVGMSPETQGKIFNPFFTTKPVGVGTGMGLSISYKIVTGDHGGTLTCDSILGQGTTFRIELPQQLPPS
ncbi:MAG: ATP-binding protein [Cyanobacteria bacterium P01_G01_bin.54]